MRVTLEQVRTLPADALAYALLPAIPPGYFRRTRFIREQLGPLLAPSTPGQPTVTHFDPTNTWVVEGAAIAAALQCLVADGVLVAWPPRDPQYTGEGAADMLMVTAWGKRVLDAGPAAATITRARRRLGVELHPTLAPKLRDSISVGAFENAAMLGLRAVESRVRRLAGTPTNDHGLRLSAGPLMDFAFRATGPLTDPSAEKGEREGQLFLFKGAFLAVRNVLNHTDEEQWDDSTEAAEYVLLADLLMRRLDHVERRMKLDAEATRNRESAEATAQALGAAGALVAQGVKTMAQRAKE